VTTGDEARREKLPFPWLSVFTFAVIGGFGLDLPTETGLSGKLVLRFGGVSLGKSEETNECCWRILGLGELGRDADVWVLPLLDSARTLDAKRLELREGEDIVVRRVGVEEREVNRVEGGAELTPIWGLEFGVEGLERPLEGVEGLDWVVVREGVDGLDMDDERVIGEDGLM